MGNGRLVPNAVEGLVLERSEGIKIIKYRIPGIQERR
jgi:hypothetical protein